MTAKELYNFLTHKPISCPDPDIVSLCRLVMEQEEEIENIRNWIRQPRNHHEDNPPV
jgi:hypothetical protein